MSSFDDFRSLGASAPLRVGYEASKRFGGHAIVFGSIARSDAADTGTSPFAFGAVPPSIDANTRRVADEICAGEITIFDRLLHVDRSPDWHGVIDGEGTWPMESWWRIDIRSEARLGDVKWAWELGRHRHLVILARAAFLDRDTVAYRTVLNRHLRSWLDTNPPETGVHWYSNLEIALRAISWLQILALAEDQLDEDVAAGMWGQLWLSGKHLTADLPYTLSAMRNNHLLGDALGLIALGMAFDGPVADGWLERGERFFAEQLERQMRPDGSMIEDSLSYQRFVLEMLTLRVVLGGASSKVILAMEDAAQFLARLGVLDGPVPQYGDWDEGRVLATADDPGNLTGSVRLGLSLAGSGAPLHWRETSGEVAWFAAKGEPIEPDPAVITGSNVGADISRVQRGSYTVWLKAGSGPSHGHADLSSISVRYEDEWLIGDPGTGTYNGDIELRTELRSSQAHSVARLDGEDQLMPHRVFRWKHSAQGMIGEPIHMADATLMWCVHDAYSRLDPPRRLVRVVGVHPAGVEVVDFVEGEEVSTTTSVPLGPKAVWSPATEGIRLGGVGWSVATRGDDLVDAVRARWSHTYGHTEPSDRLIITHRGVAPSQWRIQELGSGQGPWLEGLRVAYGPNAVELSAPTSEGRVQATVAMGRVRR